MNDIFKEKVLAIASKYGDDEVTQKIKEKMEKMYDTPGQKPSTYASGILYYFLRDKKVKQKDIIKFMNSLGYSTTEVSLRKCYFKIR